MNITNYAPLMKKYDLIVVEGYDGVGKSRVLEELSNFFQGGAYRPNYQYWTKDRLPRDKRWVIFPSIIDFLSSTPDTLEEPAIIDRGILSGAVYNNDPSILEGFKEFLDQSGVSVLHVLVLTDRSSYQKFSEARGNGESLEYRTYSEKTSQYMQYLEDLGLDYVLYYNRYSESKDFSGTCGSCGNYHNGSCKEFGYKVSADSVRCPAATSLGVQDR